MIQDKITTQANPVEFMEGSGFLLKKQLMHMKLFSTHSSKWQHFLFAVLFLGGALTFSVEATANDTMQKEDLKKDPIEITGTVTSGIDNTTLPGVNIMVKGTSNGTISDLDGNFTLKANKGDILVFTFIGFANKEVLIGDAKSISVVMNPDVNDLDEVVVIGYGTEKKSLVTGTISKVESDEITKGVVLSAGESLQGRAAGVVVQAASGQPGDGLSVNIRGVSTTGNAQPLYVVDGMPVNDVAFLNPSDIESMEVLKDAASASIYGARGGNGVILISTKKGKEGSLKINYDGYYGIQNPWKRNEALNATEYATIVNESLLNDGEAPYFSQEEIANMGEGTDWWKEVAYPNSPITNHTISLTGGSKMSTFSSSLSYFSQNGTFAEGKSNYERITARLNSNHKFGILNFGNNFSYAAFKSNGIDPNSGLSRTALITSIMNYDPTAPIYDENGDYYFSPISSNEFNNPVAMLDIINNQTIGHRVLGNMFAELEIIKDLKFRSSASLDFNYVENKAFNPSFYFTANLQNVKANVGETRSRSLQWQVENTLSYSKTLGDHSFSVLLGQTTLERNDDYILGFASSLMFNDFEYAYLGNSLDIPGSSAVGGPNQYRLASMFGRFSYNYKEKYMLSGVIRSDASTNFGTNYKTGYFPSVSAGWVLTQEDFFPENDVLTFAKLRFSWGQNGNDRLGAFSYIPILGNYTYSLGGNQNVLTGMAPLQIANPDLKWETIEQINTGLDLFFWNNKFTLSAEYYIKTTKDILIQPDAVAHAGTAPPVVNGGDVQNRGIEIETNFKQKTNMGLNYNIGLTYAYNQNEMTRIDNESKSIIGADAGLALVNATMAFEGYAINSFYGVETAGIFQTKEEIEAYVNKDGGQIQPNAQPGDLKFVDKNGDGKIDNSDRKILGNPIPKHTLGLTLSADYKGFDFSVFLYSALDYQIFNSIRRQDMRYMNWQTDVLNRWTGEGTSTEHPRLTYADPNKNYSTVSDYFLEDADMLRIKKMSLGYTLPKSVTDQVNIGKLRFYVSAENLATFTKYSGMDPEIGSAGSRDGSISPKVTMNRGIDNGVYPMARTFIFGLNLAF